VTRVSAPEIEHLIEAALDEKIDAPKESVSDCIEKVIVLTGRIRLEFKRPKGTPGAVEIPWMPKAKSTAQIPSAGTETQTDHKLLKAVVRAHAWLDELASGGKTSIAELAAAADIHPKVIRQGLRLAFLAPTLIRSAIDGNKPIKLAQVPKQLPLS